MRSILARRGRSDAGVFNFWLGQGERFTSVGSFVHD